MPKCSIQKMLHLSDEGHSTAQFLMQKIVITTYRESYDRRKTAIWFFFFYHIVQTYCGFNALP